MKICRIRTNFETTIGKSINHAKFVYSWHETFKMSVHTTKGWLSINCSYKFPFSRDTSLLKKRHVSMTSIKIVYPYTCGRCNSTYYGETDSHLKLGLGNVLG